MPRNRQKNEDEVIDPLELEEEEEREERKVKQNIEEEIIGLREQLDKERKEKEDLQKLVEQLKKENEELRSKYNDAINDVVELIKAIEKPIRLEYEPKLKVLNNVVSFEYYNAGFGTFILLKLVK